MLYNVRIGEDGRYLRCEFPVDVPFVGKDVDDVEWYFTPGDLNKSSIQQNNINTTSIHKTVNM